ncbi:hypothetical protein C8Q79DRAFT_1011353 [Trametes meyenii]|nr:hypothetical protein C8Q79DRAFT_1011353 [Trametes meyenii]
MGHRRFNLEINSFSSTPTICTSHTPPRRFSNGMNREQLQKLARAELQKLAKTHGVKANLKSEAIIAQLLERFSSAVPAGLSQNADNDAPVPAEGSQAAVRQVNHEAPDAPPKRAVRMKALQKRPVPQVAVPVDGHNNITAPATPKTRASSRKRGAKLASTKITAVKTTAGPSARTEANRSVSSASRAPYEATKQVASKHDQPPNDAPASAEGHPVGATDANENNELSDGQSPFYSISAGVPTQRRSGPEDQAVGPANPTPAPAAVASLKSPRLHDPPNVRPPSRLAAEPPQVPITMVDDDDTTWSHTDFAPAGDLEYTAQMPTGSFASTTPTAALEAALHPAFIPDQDTQEPHAPTEQVKAVVAKIADIARVVRIRRRTLNGYETRAQGFIDTAEALRTLVRQERAHRERMQNYLAYWNPIEPRWQESEIWDRECRTRIDENGNELEIVSDDEEQQSQ